MWVNRDWSGTSGTQSTICVIQANRSSSSSSKLLSLIPGNSRGWNCTWDPCCREVYWHVWSTAYSGNTPVVGQVLCFPITEPCLEMDPCMLPRMLPSYPATTPFLRNLSYPSVSPEMAVLKKMHQSFCLNYTSKICLYIYIINASQGKAKQIGALMAGNLSDFECVNLSQFNLC